jgi:hypothetical protein
MLVLDMYEEKHTEFDQPCDVIEVVMLNANRDHISTSFLGDQDTLARDMFAAMVTVTRSEFAIEYCQNRGLKEDEREYQNILQESSEKLQTLLRK